MNAILGINSKGLRPIPIAGRGTGFQLLCDPGAMIAYKTHEQPHTLVADPSQELLVRYSMQELDIIL